jgi:GNAT superfamily N-acetyltransferase
VTQEFITRPIEYRDIGQAVELYNASVVANPEGFRIDPKESIKAFILRLMDMRGHGCGEFLVGTAGREVVSLGGLDPTGMRMSNTDGQLPEIARVHVHAAHQGHGYGRKTVEALIGVAEDYGFDDVQLHVTKTQKRAIALYRRMGFVPFYDQVFPLNDGTGREYPTLFFCRPVRFEQAEFHALRPPPQIRRAYAPALIAA